MFYPKSDFCPFCAEDLKLEPKKTQADESCDVCKDSNNNSNNNSNNDSQCPSSKDEMLKKIQEVDFAIIDLNLFLDTHPECSEALNLFTELAKMSESLKNEYQKKFGPLYASKSPNEVPFKWVDACYKWPWEK